MGREPGQWRGRYTAAEVLRHAGQMVLTRREALGLTQAELARQAHVDQSGLSRFERGKSPLQFGALLRILDVLDLPPALVFPLASHSVLQEIVTLLLQADDGLQGAVLTMLRTVFARLQA